MYRGTYRWLFLSLAGFALVSFTETRLQGGDKKGETPKSIAGKTIFTKEDALTDQDDFDPTAKDCRAKTYKIKLEKGRTYQIDMITLSGPKFDTFLRLEDGKGQEVAADDDGGGDLNARIIYTPTTSGEFKIWATTFQANSTGKYKLTVIEGAEKVAGKDGPPAKGIPIKVEPGSPAKVESELTKDDPKDGQNKHFKVYTVPLQAGSEYHIHMKGNAQVDAFVRLEDEKGKLIKEDEFGDPNESNIKFKPESAGTFRIVATTYKGGMTGNFTLTVTQQGGGKVVAGGKDGKITFQKGQPTLVKGDIAATDPKDGNGKHFKAFAFQAEAGRTYKFEMSGAGGLDPEVRIEDAGGKEVKREDFGDGKVSRINAWSPAAGGSFKLIAGTFKAGATGGFTITASEEAGGAPVAGKAIPLKFPANINDKITATDAKDKGGKLHKAYSFQAQPGKTYRFEMVGQGGFDPELRIEDSTGLVVKNEDKGDGKVSTITAFTVNNPGTFTLIATSFKAGATGEYTLTATDGGKAVVAGKNPVVAAMPAFQKVTLAQITSQLTADDGTDKDGHPFKVFTFAAEANKMYRIEMTGRTFDAQLKLEDEKGQLIKMEDAFDGRFSMLTVLPGKAQTYRVIASAVVANQFGNFNLSITETQQKAAKIEEIAFERVSKITGKLTGDDGVDAQGKFFKAYSMKTQAGLTYRCEMTGADPFIRLEDSKGTKIKDEDFGDGKVSRLEFKGTGETMRVIATTFKPGMTGDFVLTIAERDKAPAPQALDIKQGKAVVNGSLADSDDTLAPGKHFKEFTFKGEAGKTYKIDLHSKAFDAYLFLRDSSGKTLDQNDDNGESLDSRIVYTISANGTYHIVATVLGKGTGAFTLTVAEIKLKNPELLALKLDKGEVGTAKGSLTDQDGTTTQGKFAKVYSFAAKKDQSYRVEVSGEGTKPVDPYVRVEDSNGKIVREEEFGDGKVSRLVFRATEDGSYKVVVTTFKAGMTGDYTLRVTRIEVKVAKAIPVQFDKGAASFTDTITKDDAQDPQGKSYKAYGLKAEKGKSYRIEMQGKAGFDPMVRVDDSQGQTIKGEDFGDGKVSRLTFTPLESGTYRVIATTFKAGLTGDYTITIAEQGKDKKDFDDKKGFEKKVPEGKEPLPKKGAELPGLPGKPFPFADGKSSVDGTIGKDDPKDKDGRPFKAFSFKAEAGKTYTFEMQGKEPLDPFAVSRMRREN